MIVVYIKENSFFKNVDPYGNIFEIQYPTREVVVSQNREKIETITETYDDYIEHGFTKIELEDKYLDCQSSDFNDDLTFSVEKYNARKEKEKEAKYEDLIITKIRHKYSVNQELAVLRQKEEKPEEYQEYFDYVELCKQEAKNAINQK